MLLQFTLANQVCHSNCQPLYWLHKFLPQVYQDERRIFHSEINFFPGNSLSPKKQQFTPANTTSNSIVADIKCEDIHKHAS